MSVQLYVEGLPDDYTEDDVLDLFEAYSSIEDVVVLNEDPSEAGGCAAVIYFEDEDEAEDATRELDGLELDGQVISVNYRKPPPKKPGSNRKQA